MEAAPFRHLPGDTRRSANAYWVQADDDIRLRIAFWPTEMPDPKGSILLFPGRTEYVEKYTQVAGDLNAAGYDVLSIDWRGQGMSDRLQPDQHTGHIGEFSDYQRDVIEMIIAATQLELPQPWHLLAHSMGGCIGLAALHADLPVKSVVFSAPMWGINLRQLPTRVALGIAWFADRVGRGGQPAPGGGGKKNYILDEAFSTNLLTCDVDQWCQMLREAQAWPDITIGRASFDWVGKALVECARLAKMDSPALPALVSLGSDEKVVSQAAIRNRVKQWPDAHLLEFDGVRHEVMMCLPEHRKRFLDSAIRHFNSV